LHYNILYGIINTKKGVVEMSHFSVAVITRKRPSEEDIEKILAPYDENLKNVPPGVAETKQQYLKNKRIEYENYKNGRYATYLQDPKTYEEENCDNPGHLEYIRNFMSIYNMTDEQILAERDGDYKHWDDEDLEYGESFIDKDGNVIVFYNLQGFWEWYKVGGRWNGCLPIKSEDENLKAGGDKNCAKIKYVDFGTGINLEALSGDPEIIKTYNKLITKGDDFYNPKYLASIYPTIEDYIRGIKYFTTFAVIDQNGMWHGKGRMGFFGCSDETPEEAVIWQKDYYKNFFACVNPEWWITIIDCHS